MFYLKISGSSHFLSYSMLARVSDAFLHNAGSLMTGVTRPEVCKWTAGAKNFLVFVFF